MSRRIPMGVHLSGALLAALFFLTECTGNDDDVQSGAPLEGSSPSRGGPENVLITDRTSTETDAIPMGWIKKQGIHPHSPMAIHFRAGPVHIRINVPPLH